MIDLTLKSLVLSLPCDVQLTGSGSLLSTFSSSPLTAVRRRTVELHQDSVLYLFDEPARSMAKHLREKLYVEGSRVLDVGSIRGKECLAVFLSDYNYGESVDDFGNVKGHLFPNPAEAQRQSRRRSAMGAPHSPEAAAEAARVVAHQQGLCMALLFPPDKATKWHMLKLLQRYSHTYESLSAAAGGGVSGGAGGVGALTAGPSPAAAGGAPSLEMLDGSLWSRAAGGQAEEPRVGSFAGVGPGRPAIAGVEEEVEEEELLPELSFAPSPAEASSARGNPVSPRVLGSPLSPCGSISTAATSGTDASASRGVLPARLLRSPLFSVCIDGQPANQACADCGEPFPTWCVLQPYGCLVCIQCVGVHRQLWSNRCREAELDRWPAEDVEFMAARGNAVVNAELEFCVSFPPDSVEGAMGQSVAKPSGRAVPAAVRAAFIRHKYAERLFTRERHPGPEPAGRTPTSSAAAAAGPAAHMGAVLAPEALLPPHLARAVEEGPPQYCGLAEVLVKELVTPAESFAGATCVITNGFQALHTRPGRKLVNMTTSTAWDEHLQVGIESVTQPLYCSVHSARAELMAAAEFHLPTAVVAAGETSVVTVDMPWCELHRRASSRHPGEVWRVTLLVSLRLLA